jgi:hypothetical protein
MEEDARKMLEARQMINKLSLVCRQVLTYMDGSSALDERRVRRVLQEAVNESNRYLNA